MRRSGWPYDEASRTTPAPAQGRRMAGRRLVCQAPAPLKPRWGGAARGPPHAARLTEGCPPFDSVSPQGTVWWHAAGPPHHMGRRWVVSPGAPKAPVGGGCTGARRALRMMAGRWLGYQAPAPLKPRWGGVARGPATRRGLGHGTPPRYPTGWQRAEPQAGGGPLRAAGRSAWLLHTHMHPRTRPHTHDTHVAIAIAITTSFHRIVTVGASSSAPSRSPRGSADPPHAVSLGREALTRLTAG